MIDMGIGFAFLGATFFLGDTIFLSGKSFLVGLGSHA